MRRGGSSHFRLDILTLFIQHSNGICNISAGASNLFYPVYNSLRHDTFPERRHGQNPRILDYQKYGMPMADNLLSILSIMILFLAMQK